MTIQSHPDRPVIRGQTFNIWTGPSNWYKTVYIADETLVGGDNPHWLELVKSGQNATNPLSATKGFVEFIPLNARGYIRYGKSGPPLGGNQDGCYGYPDGFAPAMPLASHSSSALAEAVARFNGKLYEEMRPVQGLAFVGELRETIGMLKQTGRRLLSRVQDYHTKAKLFLRSNHRSRKALKGLSDLWLESAFGWTPLFLDVASAVKSLTVPRSQKTMIRGWSEKRVVDGSYQLSNITLGTTQTLQCSWWLRNTNVSSAQLVACLDLSLVGQPSPSVVDSFSSAADRWGFTAAQFVPAVWELIPYSFLVDYFTNIGNVIDSPFADRRAIAWGYQTQRTTAVNESRFTNIRRLVNPSYDSWVTSAVPGSIKVGAKRFDRSSNLTVVPPLILSYPDFGGLKYANMAALLLGKLRT